MGVAFGLEVHLTVNDVPGAMIWPVVGVYNAIAGPVGTTT